MRARLLAAPAAAVGFLLLAPGVAMAAGSGSSSGSPTGASDAPGAYTNTLTTFTVDATGGSQTAALPGTSFSAKIEAPAGALPAGDQVEATTPELAGVNSGLSGAGFSGYKAVAGIGVKVVDSLGNPVTGTFAKPITVTLTGSGLGASGEKAIMFNSGTAATTLPTTLGTNSITITIDKDPNIAVIDPTSASTAATVANATSSHTGIPSRGIEIGAVALILAGGGALMASRRRAATR